MDWNENSYSPQILSIAELTGKLRAKLETNFPYVCVRGEVTNVGRPGSGHLYFTLKDAEAQLACVWFKHHQPRNNFNSLTGEILDESQPQLAREMINGVEVVCGGKISVYSARGQYQLIVEFAEYSGEGALALAFERQKRKLAAKGYFLAERKKKIPKNPEKVILITSPSGAALHDFMELANLRGLSSKIRLIPVNVQGRGSAAQIAAAISLANASDWGDVIVLARGGGAPEDLAAFNEEIVADAIYLSRIPVIAGIGHEIDVSIADLAADARAATPSHAAELLWSARSEISQRIDDLDNSLHIGIFSVLEKNFFFLDREVAILASLSPLKNLQSLLEAANAAQARLDYEMRLKMEKSLKELASRVSRLRGLSPHDRLSVSMERIINLIKLLHLYMAQASSEKKTEIEGLRGHLKRAMTQMMQNLNNSLESVNKLLPALDPGLPLKNGYCLLYADDKLVTSSAGLNPGDDVTIVMRDAEMSAELISIRNRDNELQK